MRIGELAKRSGLSRDTLRFYERQGLIHSRPEGGQNSYRAYGEDCLMTLEVIADAQAAGMTIADLSQFLTQLQAEEGEAFDGIAFLDARIAETEERLSRTRRFLRTLKETRAALIRAPGG